MPNTLYKQVMLDRIFREILNSKSFDDISITRLSRQVGISRQTFYYYFDSITDMLEYYLSIEEYYFLRMSNHPKGSAKNVADSICYCRTRPFIAKLVKSEKYGYIFRNYLKKFIYDYFFNTVMTDCTERDIMQMEYHCSAIINMSIIYILQPDRDPSILEEYELQILKQEFDL